MLGLVFLIGFVDSAFDELLEGSDVNGLLIVQDFCSLLSTASREEGLRLATEFVTNVILGVNAVVFLERGDKESVEGTASTDNHVFEVAAKTGKGVIGVAHHEGWGHIGEVKVLLIKRGYFFLLNPRVRKECVITFFHECHDNMCGPVSVALKGSKEQGRKMVKEEEKVLLKLGFVELGFEFQSPDE